MVTKGLRERLKVGSKPLQSLDPGPRFDLPGPGAAMPATDLGESARLEPVPEKCGRFSNKDKLTSKGIEHFR